VDSSRSLLQTASGYGLCTHTTRRIFLPSVAQHTDARVCESRDVGCGMLLSYLKFVIKHSLSGVNCACDTERSGSS
jgi:hypothetical protein